MAGPVYKMFYARMKEPWFQLSKEQQNEIGARMEETLKNVGAKRLIACNAYWSSEKWWFWGVEEFPSIEAVQEYAKCLEDVEWFRYCEAETMLGTPETPQQA